MHLHSSGNTVVSAAAVVAMGRGGRGREGKGVIIFWSVGLIYIATFSRLKFQDVTINVPWTYHYFLTSIRRRHSCCSCYCCCCSRYGEGRKEKGARGRERASLLILLDCVTNLIKYMATSK